MPKKVYVMSQPSETATEEEKNAFVPQPMGLKFLFEDNSETAVDFEKIPDDIKLRAMFHGFSQKIGDSYAGAAKAEEGALAFSKKSVAETLAQLYAGEWRATAEGGPKAPSDLAIALSRITGKTPEEAQKFVESLDDEQKKVYRKKAKVAAHLASIAAEKAKIRAEKLARAAAATPEGTEEGEEEEDITIPDQE